MCSYMASVASRCSTASFPCRRFDGNVTGLRNLLDYFRDRSLAGFLFFSSSEGYVNSTDDAIPTPETYRNMSQASQGALVTTRLSVLVKHFATIMPTFLGS